MNTSTTPAVRRAPRLGYQVIWTHQAVNRAGVPLFGLPPVRSVTHHGVTRLANGTRGNILCSNWRWIRRTGTGSHHA